MTPCCRLPGRADVLAAAERMFAADATATRWRGLQAVPDSPWPRACLTRRTPRRRRRWRRLSSRGAEASVSKWLASQGYRLEMRTTRAMRRAGLAVRCSDDYIDPETGKARELHVAACRNVAIGEMLNRQVRVLIECKAAMSGQQWVGCCSNDGAARARPSGRASSQGQRWLELLWFKIVPGETAVSLLQQSPPRVHGLVATWQNGAGEQQGTATHSLGRDVPQRPGCRGLGSPDRRVLRRAIRRAPARGWPDRGRAGGPRSGGLARAALGLLAHFGRRCH